MAGKIDGKPKDVMGGKAWYYEYPGSIEIVIPADFPEFECTGGRFVKITRRMLEKSLARMKASRRGRKG